MANESGRLEADPLFLGLTRPPVILGVTYGWFMINAMTWALVFINTSDFTLLFPGAATGHFIGYLITSKEPRYLDIWMVKISKCMKCRNKLFHGGTNSYDLY